MIVSALRRERVPPFQTGEAREISTRILISGRIIFSRPSEKILYFHFVCQLVEFIRIVTGFQTQWAGLHLDARTWRGCFPAGRNPGPQQVVHHGFERLPSLAGPRLEHSSQIIVNCQCRSHGQIVAWPFLMSRHQTSAISTIGCPMGWFHPADSVAIMCQPCDRAPCHPSCIDRPVRATPGTADAPAKP